MGFSALQSLLVLVQMEWRPEKIKWKVYDDIGPIVGSHMVQSAHLPQHCVN